MKWNFGDVGLVSSNKGPDGQCWNGQKSINWKLIVGGSKAIDVNERFK